MEVGMLLLKIFFCTCAVDLMFVHKNILAVSYIGASFMSTKFEETFRMLVPKIDPLIPVIRNIRVAVLKRGQTE
jgi:hypothetical protein